MQGIQFKEHEENEEIRITRNETVVISRKGNELKSLENLKLKYEEQVNYFRISFGKIGQRWIIKGKKLLIAAREWESWRAMFAYVLKGFST